MAAIPCIIIFPFLIFLILPPTSSSFPSTILISPPTHSFLVNDGRRSSQRKALDLYCESWKFTVETNDAGTWAQIPERCVDFVKEYVTGARYAADSEAVADRSADYAKSVQVSGDGKDAWIFDVDETLLSNLPYYAARGFGSEYFNETAFDEWVDKADAPAISPSLRLYIELQDRGFSIFLLTGRSEFQRNCTADNLTKAGFKNWKRLILRGDEDIGKTAWLYKSEKRKEIENEGYIIRGNSGDQWSDLTGFSLAERSFKLPNPMYFVG